MRYFFRPEVCLERDGSLTVRVGFVDQRMVGDDAVSGPIQSSGTVWKVDGSQPPWRVPRMRERFMTVMRLKSVLREAREFCAGLNWLDIGEPGGVSLPIVGGGQ